MGRISQLDLFIDGKRVTFRPSTPSQVIGAGSRCRLKTDAEVPDWGFMPRVLNPKWRETHLINGEPMEQAPETVRVNAVTGKSAFTLAGWWQEWYFDNNTPAAYKYVTRNGSGLVNKAGWPVPEILAFRDNEVIVERRDGVRCYLKHLNNAYRPPSTIDPVLIHRFTVITNTGATIFPDPPGDVILIPFVFPCDIWIDVGQLALVMEA